MRRIIDGLLYDTDTAEIIYEDNTNNRHRVYYKTTNGRFFVVYQTGELAPKTETQIKELLGTYDVDKYIELFNEPKEA
jgi:regulator of protease activity HflC (stomatin/prohibitin superfamily)